MCCGALPRRSAAQAWFADRDRIEGHGLRIGDLEFHPGIGAELGFETNPFLEADQVGEAGGLTVEESVKPSATMRVSPHLFLSTLGEDRLTDASGVYTPPSFAFRGGLSGSLQWLGVGPGTRNYGGVGQVRYLGRVDLDETFLPERPFSVGFEQEGSINQLPLQGQQSNHYHAAAGTRIEFGTRGGLLRAILGYKFNLDRYDALQNDGHDHRLQQRLLWEFLPKTALFQDLEVTMQTYDKAGKDSFLEGADEYAFLIADKVNNDRVNTRVGVNGAVTKTLAATVSLGYGAVFFGEGNQARDAEGLIGQAQVNWEPSERISSAAGYGRDVSSALQGNTVVVNHFFVRGELVVGGVFLVGAEGRLGLYDYGDDEQQRALAEGVDSALLDSFGLRVGARRSDVKLTVDLNGEYRLSNWLAFTGQLSYDTNFSDYAFLFPDLEDVTRAMEAAATTSGDVTPEVSFASPIGYTNVVAMVGVRAFL